MWFLSPKEKVKAVYEEDLIKYLKSLGIYDALLNAEKLCVYCGNPVTLSNLEIIMPIDNQIQLVCNNRNCLNQI